MRIAHWVRVGNKYGSLEKYFVMFSHLCALKGYPFAILSEIENTTEEYRASLMQYGTEFVTIGESGRHPWQVSRKVDDFIKTWKPDIVHLHFINPIAAPFLKLMGVPLVYQTYHSGIEHRISIPTRFVRWVNNFLVAQIYAVSEKVRRDEIKAGVSPKKISISYLGLPFEIFTAHSHLVHEPTPPFWNRSDVRKIITVGRFFPIKGMRYVTDAAIRVVQELEDVVWWLVGKEGSESSYCEERVREAGLGERIFFLGERNDVPALIRLSSLHVIGSLHEGFGLMALESAALGVPTIGTKIEGLDEVVLDGKSGLLVQARSGGALAEATLTLLDDQELWEQMSNFAMQYARSRFDSGKSIASILDDYARDLKYFHTSRGHK